MSCKAATLMRHGSKPSARAPASVRAPARSVVHPLSPPRHARRNRPANSALTESNFFVVSDLTPLSEVLAIFKSSFSHLMIAASFSDLATGAVLTPAQMASWVADGSSSSRPQPFTSTFTGVITLEDVIEEVIDHEIVDEHDRYKSNDTKALNDRVRRRWRRAPRAPAPLALLCLADASVLAGPPPLPAWSASVEAMMHGVRCSWHCLLPVAAPGPVCAVPRRPAPCRPCGQHAC